MDVFKAHYNRGYIGNIKMAISQEPLDLQNSKPGTNRAQITTNKMAY